MWLGSTQLLDGITRTDVPVLGMCIVISESTHDLDSELSLAVHVTAVCQDSYNTSFGL